MRFCTDYIASGKFWHFREGICLCEVARTLSLFSMHWAAGCILFDFVWCSLGIYANAACGSWRSPPVGWPQIGLLFWLDVARSRSPPPAHALLDEVL